MNAISVYTLKVLRKLYTQVFGSYKLPILQIEDNPEKASEMIYNLLSSNKPCMIARFGANELNAIVNYLGVNSKNHSYSEYIKGRQKEWWWNKNITYHMQNNAGFFPATANNMQKFGDLMLSDIKELDLLGCWIANEAMLSDKLKYVKKVHLRLLEPFWSKTPWTRFLEGKRVVVVHPFKEDILIQYNNHRSQLFSNTDILPRFSSLHVIKAVQSLGGEDNGFKDWFDALQWMKNEIDKEDYDVCLIGCGAYGFPLAAHVKRQGKQAIHLGGALQLLFGIKGKRWEDSNYGVKEWNIPYGSYTSLMNEYWIRPNNIAKPKNIQKVENGCYW